jgi:hypothetical protein
VQAVQTVRLQYHASDELSSLFEAFRLMCNDAIRIAVKQKPTSRFKLIELAYPRLKDYGLHTHYILSACEVAHSVFKNRTRKRLLTSRGTSLSSVVNHTPWTISS